MTRNLLLLLVCMLYVQSVLAQQASILGNVLWDSYNERIVVRIAIRNNTNANSNCQIAAVRIGYQFNENVLTPAGFRSYFYNGIDQSTGLNDALCYTGSGGIFSPDSNTPVDDGTRNASITGGGSKTLKKNYINRSTSSCENLWVIPASTYRIAMDLYFKFKPPYMPADYSLNTSGYGFGMPGFIAQFITDMNQALSDSKKEIAVLIDHTAGSPYQPWDQSGSNCNSGSINPVPITDNAVNFINPINGVLAGKVDKLDVIEKNDYVFLKWDVDNNQMIDHFEIERKEENGSFKTAGIVLSDNNSSALQYWFKDKITVRDVNLYYRIKIFFSDAVVLCSDTKLIRPESAQTNSIVLFPNPATDIVKFKSAVSTGNYVCRIYNSDGRMLMTESLPASDPQLKVKQLNTGSYFIELYHVQNGTRFYSRFKKL